MPSVGRDRIARDWGAWLCVLAIVPLVIHSLPAPLGEPFADDFHYLRTFLFPRGVSLFDGFGSPVFWRPLGRQLYYFLIAPILLGAPAVVPIVHGALLAIASVVAYRAFRPTLSWPAAATIATFPLLMESSRMLLGWSSNFQDVGAIFFAAIAVHESTRNRLPTAAGAIACSLLCKEVGAGTALLLPFVPTRLPDANAFDRRMRDLTWCAVMAGIVAVWATVYLIACRTHGMIVPHGSSEAPPQAGLALKYAWALWNALRAAMSLTAAPGRFDTLILLATALVVGAALVMTGTDPRKRRALRGALPWMAWGFAWFAAASVPLTTVFPDWIPYRAVYGSLGLGIVLGIVCGIAHPLLLVGLVLCRLMGFAVSPGPPPDLSGIPSERGAAFDFERLVRLERFTLETRQALKRRFPTLPAGAVVATDYLPRLSEYALAGDRALHVWYRDTTLRFINFTEFERDPSAPIATIIEYQPETKPQIALVEPEAMRRFIQARDSQRLREYAGALDLLRRADSLQVDDRAVVFRGSVAGERAYALLGLGKMDACEREGRRAVALWRQSVPGHFAIACACYARGAFGEAEAHVDTVLGYEPGHRDGQRLKASIDRALTGGAAGPR